MREASAAAAPLQGPLDDLLAGLDEDERRGSAELAHLPLLSAEVAEACAGAGALAAAGRYRPAAAGGTSRLG